jgi:predicted NBD/HSP70 family sugar kinase
MYLLFDNGGTKTRVAYSDDGETFCDPIIFSTENKLELQLKKLDETAKKLVGDNKLEAVAGGIAGPLDKDNKCLVNSPNLRSWVGLPIKEELVNIFNVPVFLENDSAMVGLGEAMDGAGRGYNIVAYLTISTGVGGVRIVGKQIDQNIFGFEPGHQIIDYDGTICPKCKDKGHLEGYISGSAVEERYGKKPFDIEDAEVWEKEAELLAVGLNNIAVLWSPEIIVLGGSMMKTPGIAVPHVENHLKKILKIFPSVPEIKKAELGDFGGLHGALAYVKQQTGLHD